MWNFRKLIGVLILAASPMVFASSSLNTQSSEMKLAYNGYNSNYHNNKCEHGNCYGDKYLGHKDKYPNKYYGNKHHQHYWYSGWRNAFWYPDVYFWKHGKKCLKSCYRNSWGDKRCNVQCNY